MTKTERLVELFKEKQLLARAAGVSNGMVTRWVRDGVVPSKYNHAIMTDARRLRLDVAAVSAQLMPHVCPCCGAPLEPGGDTATVTA